MKTLDNHIKYFIKEVITIEILMMETISSDMHCILRMFKISKLQLKIILVCLGAFAEWNAENEAAEKIWEGVWGVTLPRPSHADPGVQLQWSDPLLSFPGKLYATPVFLYSYRFIMTHWKLMACLIVIRSIIIKIM